MSDPASRPILLGIVGDSGAGKTTLARGLAELLGSDRVTHLRTDDYHRYDRAERLRAGITALHPDCNYLDILELHLERLHYGQPILKPVYDHSNGTLVRPEYVQPRDFVVVEGLLAFHTPVMRQFYDVKVYLDPPEELRKAWKVRRDTTRRGYTAEQVLEELEKRAPDARAFVRPQRSHADIVVRFSPPPGVPAERAGAKLDVRLILRPTIPHPDLSYLFDGAPSPGIRMLLERDSGRPADILQVDGSVTPGHAARLEETIWRHLPSLRPLPGKLFGIYHDRGESRHSDTLALTQLLLIYQLFREREMLARRFAPPVAALSRLRPDMAASTAVASAAAAETAPAPTAAAAPAVAAASASLAPPAPGS